MWPYNTNIQVALQNQYKGGPTIQKYTGSPDIQRKKSFPTILIYRWSYNNKIEVALQFQTRSVTKIGIY